MNNILKIFSGSMAAFVVVLSIQFGAFAEVYTSSEVIQSDGVVCIAGNDDFYPVEYYNRETGIYEGVIPRILEDISSRTEVDFVYIRNGQSQAELAQNPDIHIVSGYVTDRGVEYVKTPLTIFSCADGRKHIDIGWGFTDTADEKLISQMQDSISRISEQDINGHLLLSSSRQDDVGYVPLLILCIVITIAIAVSAFFRIRNIQQKLRKDKTIDAETGIGNLLYFENSFEKLVTAEAREKYYVAYIIIDSNYLLARHGEVTFKDSVKYTAGVLTSHVSDGQFVGRITENVKSLATRLHLMTWARAIHRSETYATTRLTLSRLTEISY